MMTPPNFLNDKDYLERAFEPEFWWPCIQQLFTNNDSSVGNPRQLDVGIGGTYPTFLYGNTVLKIFGHVPYWAESFHDERLAHKSLATDSTVLAPKLCKAGYLFPGEAMSWPYLMTTRVSGVSWHDACLNREQRLHVATELGIQIRHVQRLPSVDLPTMRRWRHLDITKAATYSSFPPHLVPQIGPFLSRLESFDETVVHGDLFSRHVFVEDGSLKGIIDWGDIMFCDRHYEIPKLFLDTFACDKDLLRAFLNAAEWRVQPSFAGLSMGMALYRQAIGSEQHLTNDVFYRLPSLFPLEDIATLDELAVEVFAV